MKNMAGGLLTALLTDDMAASVLVAQDGKRIVQAFCLACGAIWLPLQTYLVDAVRGKFGDDAQSRARGELEQLVDRGSGFKLASAEAVEMAGWAKSVLASAGHGT